MSVNRRRSRPGLDSAGPWRPRPPKSIPATRARPSADCGRATPARAESEPHMRRADLARTWGRRSDPQPVQVPDKARHRRGAGAGPERPGLHRTGGWSATSPTYLPACPAGGLYLATVIDLHTLEVIGHAMAGHIRAELVRDALDLSIRRGLIGDELLSHVAKRRHYRAYADSRSGLEPTQRGSPSVLLVVVTGMPPGDPSRQSHAHRQ